MSDLPTGHAQPGSRPSARPNWLGKHAKPIFIGLTVTVIAAAAGYALLSRQKATDHQAKAAALLKQQDIQGALIEYKNAIQLEPDNGIPRLALGMLHYARGQMDDAEKEFRLAAKDRRTPQAWPMLARTLLHLNQAKRVLNEIQPLAQGPAPINAEIHALLAQAQLRLGHETAVDANLKLADAQDADHAVTLGVRAIQALKQGKVELARTLLDQALAKAPGNGELWQLKGDLLLSQKLQAEALAAYAQATRVEPFNMRARLAYANLLMQSKDFNLVEAQLQAARRLAPNNLMLRHQEAMLAFRRGNAADALNKVQDVLRAAPDLLPARLLAGMAALTSGRTETALSHLEFVSAQSPDSAVAKKLLAIAKMQTGQNREAQTLLRDLDQAFLNDPMLLAAQGTAALREQDFAAARQHLEKAVALSPLQPDLLTKLATSQMGSGDEAGAIASLERAASLDKESVAPEIMLVQMHLKAKRLDQAVKEIDKIEKKQPKNPMVSNLRGIVAMAKDDRQAARTQFARALQLQPAYLPAAGNLARLDIQAKDYKAARQRFESVLEHAPGNARAWIALAQLAALQNDEKTFLDSLLKAKQANQAAPEARALLISYWLRKRDYRKAQTEALESLDSTGNKNFYDPLGMAQAMQGNHQDALATYSKWVKAAPTSPNAHYRLAQAQEVAGKTGAALASVEQALKLAPDYPDAVLAKAKLLSLMNNPDEAIRLARDFQKRHSDSPVGFLAEAIAQEQAKRPADAARLYQRAAQTSGNGAYLLRAKAMYLAAGKAQTGEALLGDWINKHPQDRQVRHALAQTLLDNGRNKEAIGHYETLLKSVPNDLVALNNLAWAYGTQKDARAISTAEQAYRLQPKNPSVLDTYGWLLVEANQAQRGIPLLRQALAAQPESADIRWHLGAALAKAGDKANAIAELDRLLASRVPFAQATEARALLQQLQASR